MNWTCFNVAVVCIIKFELMTDVYIQV